MATNVLSRHTDTAITPNRLPDVIDRLIRDSFVYPTRADRDFNGSWHFPSSNLLETDDAYLVQFVLPGAAPESINCKVSGREVLVTGILNPMDMADAHYLWHGFDGGEFSESCNLPDEVDGNMTKAEYANGILTITAPKASSAKPQSVEVVVK